MFCVILNAPMTWLRGPRSIWDSNSFSSIPISTRASLVLAATSDNSSEAVVEAEDLWGSRLKLLSASGQSALQSHLLSRIYKIAKRNWIYIGLKYFWKEHLFFHTPVTTLIVLENKREKDFIRKDLSLYCMKSLV